MLQTALKLLAVPFPCVEGTALRQPVHIFGVQSVADDASEILVGDVKDVSDECLQ